MSTITQEDRNTALERELQAKADHAAEQGQQLEAMKKELGMARKEAEKVAGLERENARLQADLDSANAQLQRQQSDMERAGARADAGDSMVEAAKKIADGLRQLGAL